MRSTPLPKPEPILGLSAPSFVVVAAALTLTFAVLAGQVESHRASAAAPTVAARKTTGGEPGSGASPPVQQRAADQTSRP